MVDANVLVICGVACPRLDASFKLSRLSLSVQHVLFIHGSPRTLRRASTNTRSNVSYTRSLSVSAYLVYGIQMAEPTAVTLEKLAQILQADSSVKVAGIDVDGVLRGKLMSKNKFLSIAKAGFGFCSVIFGWDMHDQSYVKELKISNAQNGYRDLLAVPDLRSFRRIPWENGVPFFLVEFINPDDGEPLSACPRQLLKRISAKLENRGLKAMAGGELVRM